MKTSVLSPTVLSVRRSMAVLTGPIQDDLAEVERIIDTTLSTHRSGSGGMIEHLDNYRGKRLRPMLLLLTARACGQLRTAHHTLAAVVEMVHTATLVHDDVLDDADTRRHVSTVNARWGNKASILLGDVLFSHAFHLASSVGDARACRIIGDATNRVCAGEMQQVVQRGNLALTEEDYFQIIDGKTAALTACCCELGALYAGAEATVTARLTEYGRLLGLAFQVADDLLDLVGTEEAVGKTLGTDLEQQKLTLPVIHLLSHAPAEVAKTLRQAIRTQSRGVAGTLLTAMRQYGSIDYARKRAEGFVAAARAALAVLPNSEARQLLEQAAELSLKRET